MIDTDRHGREDGVANFAALVAQHVPLPDHPIAKTAGDGEHHYFRQWNGETFGNSEGALRGQEINVRGKGGWAVAPGSVRPTARRWAPAGLTAAYHENTIPLLPDWLAAMIRPPREPEAPAKPTNGAAPPRLMRSNPESDRPAWSAAEEARVRDALHHIPSEDRTTWFEVGASLHHTGWPSARAMWDAWSQTTPSAFDADDQDKNWQSFDRPYSGKPRTLASLFHLAQANGYQQKPSQPEQPIKPEDAYTQAPPPGLGEWDAGNDTELPPPRGWLLGNIFARKFMSSLLADGGVGKTALRYAQLLSVAIGRSLTGDHVFARSRVLIISLEDGPDELRRRILALLVHYHIDRSELRGWLFLAAPGAAAGKLMTLDKAGRTQRGALADAIEAVVIKRKIDLVSIDPFVKAHSVEENSNSAIDDVVQVLTDLADKHNIAVDAPHHTSKGTADPGNANRGRGASSMKDGGRLVYTLAPMSPEEAQAFGLKEEERRMLIRMDSGKVNIAPPMSAAKWFRLVGVPLGNATDLYPNGDEVQAVEPWTPPDTWAGLSHHTLNQVLTAIDAGLPDGNRYSDARNVTDRAAWKVVLQHAPNKTETQAREIIKTWVKNGVLVAEDYENPVTRHQVRGLQLDTTKRPS